MHEFCLANMMATCTYLSGRCWMQRILHLHDVVCKQWSKHILGELQMRAHGNEVNVVLLREA